MTIVFIEAALPIAIDPASPVTWFVAAVAAIVLALTISTRRSTQRPRSILPVRPAAQVLNPVHPAYAAAWSAAQTLFFADPRAACEQADLLVGMLLQERSNPTSLPEDVALSLAAAQAVLARNAASTEDLRAAFTALRSVFDTVLAGRPA